MRPASLLTEEKQQEDSDVALEAQHEREARHGQRACQAHLEREIFPITCLNILGYTPGIYIALRHAMLIPGV